MSENKGCPKNMFSDAKKIIFSVKNRRCSKTKGVRQHGVITAYTYLIMQLTIHNFVLLTLVNCSKIGKLIFGHVGEVVVNDLLFTRICNTNQGRQKLVD